MGKPQRFFIGMINPECESNTQVLAQETKKQLHILYKEENVHVRSFTR